MSKYKASKVYALEAFIFYSGGLAITGLSAIDSVVLTLIGE